MGWGQGHESASLCWRLRKASPLTAEVAQCRWAKMLINKMHAEPVSSLIMRRSLRSTASGPQQHPQSACSGPACRLPGTPRGWGQAYLTPKVGVSTCSRSEVHPYLQVQCHCPQ